MSVRKLNNLERAYESAALDVLDLHLWTDLTHGEEDEVTRREKMFSDWKQRHAKNATDKAD